MSAITERLSNFFSSAEYPVLFAGAGVSAHAGLPPWTKLLTDLMELARPQDHITALQMGEAIREGRLLRAADYYYLSDKILDGDRLQTLRQQFEVYDFGPLRSIAALPVKEIYTTNFDRSLIEAVAAVKSKVPLDLRRGDVSFKQSLWEAKLHVTRLHGAAEFPSSICLNSRHFEELLEDDVYKDILTGIFTRRNVLFLGFSFYDPAIKHVLEQLNKEYGSGTPGRHLALLPNDASAEFLSRAARLNIEILKYSEKEDHKELWLGLDEFTATKPIASTSATTGSAEEPMQAAKKYLSACYARARLGATAHDGPLREVVVEGIVASLLQAESPKSVSLEKLTADLHAAVGLSRDEVKPLLRAALKRLRDEKLCTRHKSEKGEVYLWSGAKGEDSSLDKSIDTLVNCARNRAIVQEGWRTTSDVATALRKFFGDLVLKRGWDLGAAFAGNRPPDVVDIKKQLWKCSNLLSPLNIERLERICESMLRNPSDEEAGILAELGRIAFALEIALQTPRTTLLHEQILPQYIYLDASVLMPALVPGHPFNSLYSHSIERLRVAAAKATSPLQLIVYHGYLNEIVSHRKLALQFSKEFGDDLETVAKSEVLLHGGVNANVFVAGYANWVAQNPGSSFFSFLSAWAPYESENELERWLTKKGYVIIRDQQARGPKFPEISFLLQKGYATQLAAGKDFRLIEHDAAQISALEIDRRKQRRSLFVTADRRLRALVSEADRFGLADNIIGHVGLVQLIELLLGNVGDSHSLTSLLWSTATSDKAKELRSYLTSVALAEYNEAIAMAMPELVDSFSQQALQELERQGLAIDSENPRSRAAVLRIVGTHERGFFEGMRAAIERREREGRA